MRLFLFVTFLAMSAVAQEKTYDLSLEVQPQVGQKCKLAESNQMSLSMFANGAAVPATQERKVFEATEVVVEADGKGNNEFHRTYSKAQHLEQGVFKPYGFQGKTVKVTQAKGQSDTFAYVEGGEIAAEDLEALESSFSDGEGDDDDSNPFKPPKRMRVGESWNPDIRAVAKMFDDDMADSADYSKSTARFTLKAVEKRKGVEFGKIDGLIELALNKIGPLTPNSTDGRRGARAGQSLPNVDTISSLRKILIARSALPALIFPHETHDHRAPHPPCQQPSRAATTATAAGATASSQPGRTRRGS